MLKRICMLALAAGVAAAGPPFRFDAPPGPQFSEEQRQAQREAGQRIMPMVMEAFQRGSDAVRIPPGDYRFGQEKWGRDGVIFPLEFSGLKRDAQHPFTIDATGATFWFDLADDQAPTCHFCVGFKDCANLVFRGATLDRGTRGHVEGRITAFDFPGNRIEIQLSPGLAVPTNFSDGMEQRLIPFKADGTFCAPLYALQAGGTKLKYRSITAGTEPGSYWVELREKALLETIRDPDWLRAHGEQGVLRVGDGLSCVYAVSASIELMHSGNLTMDGLRVYVPKGCGSEVGGDGGHAWRNCYFGPRPGTSQWQGGEGFMFNATRRGTTLDGVTIVHTADDIANFHGYWGHITNLAGNRVSFEAASEFRRTVLRDARAGDRVLFHDRTTGQPLGDAVVTGIDGATVTVDQDVESFTNAIVEWPDHACAGWLVQNCRFEDNYQRLLIQSGPGTVRGCTFTRQGSALELNSVMPYVEGGVPRDITIAENTFTDVAPAPRRAAITTYAHTFDRAGTATFPNIVIIRNTFDRPVAEAVQLRHAPGAILAGNRQKDPPL